MGLSDRQKMINMVGDAGLTLVDEALAEAVAQLGDIPDRDKDFGKACILVGALGKIVDRMEPRARRGVKIAMMPLFGLLLDTRS